MSKNFKALTFSFDDGVLDDIRLIEIFNKYGLKGTFNLSGGILTSASRWKYKEKDVIHVNYFDNPNLYNNHEIACHGYTHPYLEKLDRKTAENEVRLDKKILEALYGVEVRGMAYPFGTYSDEIIEILKESGIEYSRGIKSHHTFDIPANPYVWDPTCHFLNERLMEHAQNFVNLKEGPAIFYVWGHSYEFITEEDWQRFEEFCKFIAFRDDITYCTNIEIIDMLK